MTLFSRIRLTRIFSLLYFSPPTFNLVFPALLLKVGWEIGNNHHLVTPCDPVASITFTAEILFNTLTFTSSSSSHGKYFMSDRFSDLDPPMVPL